MGALAVFKPETIVAAVTWVGKNKDTIAAGAKAAQHGANMINAARQDKSLREKIGDMAGHADQLLGVAAALPIVGEIPDALRLATSAVHVAGAKDFTTALHRASQKAGSIAIDAIPGAALVNDAGMLVTRDHTDLATTAVKHLTGSATHVETADSHPPKTPAVAGKISPTQKSV